MPIENTDTWLNYHHLYYFWTAVREGSVSAAARKLRLAQPTVSGQLKALEDSFGLALFNRKGNKLGLTDAGSHVYRYADEIFTLGRELRESLAGRLATRRSRLVVGIADVMPKLIAHRLLDPALRGDDGVRLLCYEDRHDRLMADLALHELDVVLSDMPVGPADTIQGFSHLLGESGVSLFAKPKVAERLRRHFPSSLDGVAFLLPIEHTSLRRALTKWLDQKGLRPQIRGEFQDSAMLTVFGQLGAGVFAAPTVIEDDLRSQHRVEVIARLDGLRERFYAITVDRRITHPAVAAICERARVELFTR
jgi:LysR family transcriptional activator of nhaA